MILSTHILQEVDAICDRVVIINKGEIVLDFRSTAKNQQQIIEVSFDYRIETPSSSSVKNTHDFDYENSITQAHDNGKNESLEALFNELTGFIFYKLYANPQSDPNTCAMPIKIDRNVFGRLGTNSIIQSMQMAQLNRY